MSMIYGLPTGVNAKMPYQPAIDEILYVEGKHTIKIDRWRIEYYSEIIKDSKLSKRLFYKAKAVLHV